MAAYTIIDQAHTALADARQNRAPEETVAALESGLSGAERLVATDVQAARSTAERVYYKARGLARGWDAIAMDVRAYLLCQQPGDALFLLAVTRSGQVVGIHGPEPQGLWRSRDGVPVGQIDGRKFEEATWEFLDTEYWVQRDGWKVVAWYGYDGDYNRKG